MSERQQDHRDFGEIIRNTLLVGGGSAVNMTIGLIRTKFLAGMLGPSGIAINSLLTQIFEVGGAATGLGLGASGVRQIAAARASKDPHRVAHVVKALQRTVWCTGLFALLALTLFSGPIAEFTFGNQDRQWAIVLLAGVVFFRAILTGQACLLQGMRRIADGVKVGIAGSIAALVVTIPSIYWLGERGIAVALLGTAVVSLVASWWFARKVTVQPIVHSWSNTWVEARSLASFGLPMMLVSLVGTLGPYGERIILIRTIGIEQLGLYHAAYALTGIALSFILNAMTADFYPKLVGYVGDHERMGKEVNAQVEASILLIMPAITWLMVLSPWIVTLLYSGGFQPAAVILEITIFGAIGRVLCWPLRLVWLAQGKSGRVFLFEGLVALAGFGVTAILSTHFGSLGAGIAFSALHLCTAALLVVFSPQLLGVTISWSNCLRVLGALAFLALLWINAHFNSNPDLRIVIGLLSASALSFYVARALLARTGRTFSGLRH